MKKYTKKNTGGVVAKDTAPSEVYAGGGSNVVKEAKARKRGGKAMGKVHGDKAPKRADRMARKSGGSCVDNPMSSAAKGTPPKAHKVS